MHADRWELIEQLCQEALDRPKEQQEVFLELACGQDQELRREVESLLAHRWQAENFIEAPAMELAARAVAADQHGSTAGTSRQIGRLISHYRIVEEVASGGMGDVYRAVRADGTYDKQVAIKLIQGARSTDFFLARFQNERQILADLDHPNIARLLDGGTTAEGLPYVVMEYIQGLPIDEFCEQKSLTVRERLEVFRTVCSAVHYAHQNLVVHRDLKPSNILVTADGVPKLLDFGIAKMLNPHRGEPPLEQTVTVMRMLTPDYASPEQLRNEPISTASDIYSLGVILYELLTGLSPYRVATDSPQELMKAICDTQPEKPSVSVMLRPATEGASLEQPSSFGSSTRPVAEKRGKLRKVLAGDLDNIVLNALRKEPQRRYSSAEQFSEDIRRYLVGLPVVAHEDSMSYRARKFVARHKLGVAAVLLLVASLAGGLVGTLWQAHVAKLERARAERRFNDVRKLANSLMFEVHDSIRDLPGATAARKLIIQRAQEYLDSLAQESKSDPALLRELATAYSRLAALQGDSRGANLGDTTVSLQNYHRAIELGRAAVALDPHNRDLKRGLAEDYTRLDLPLFQKGDRNGERECLREALRILEPLSVSNQQDLPSQFALSKAYELDGSLLFRENNRDGALESYAKALHINEVLAKVDPQNAVYRANISFGHKHLGSVLLAQNHLDEALDHYRQALAIDEANLAANPDNLSSRYYITYNYDEIGHILGKRGDLETALSYYHKALDIRAAMVAADPRDTRAQAGLATTYNSIGPLLQRKGDYSGALEMLEKALHIREALAQGDPANERFRFSIAETQALLGELYVARAAHTAPEKQAGYCREAQPWFEHSLPVYLQIQSEGKLRLEDLEFLGEIQKAAERCAQTIARSGQKGSPPTPVRPN